jgi:hypothetical protein
MTPRCKPNKTRPWQWQDKEIHRLILRLFDQSRNASSGLAVYVSLTHIASNEQSETFDATIDHIAQYAGVSGSTTKRVLKVLEASRLIAIRLNYANGLQLSSTYTILAGGLPLVHRELAAGHRPIRGPRTTYEESSEESSEKSDDDGKAQGSSIAVEQLGGNGESSSLSEEINKKEWDQFERYCKSKGGTPTIKGFQTWKLKFKAKPQFKHKPRHSTAQAIVQSPGWNTRPVGDFEAAADVLKGVVRKLKSPKVDGAHSRNA